MKERILRDPPLLTKEEIMELLAIPLEAGESAADRIQKITDLMHEPDSDKET